LIYFIFRDDTYSAGKRTIKGPYFEDQENSRKMPGNYILSRDSGSQKEESRGSRGQPHA
jgi:hypothetical protein